MQTLPRNHWTTQRARELRHGDNAAEGALWNVLKARKLGGYKFVRQFPIGPYFADFAHRQKRLVIEVDGSQHVESVRDERRDAFILNNGIAVLRFWSNDVLRHREVVCDTILAVLEGRMEAVRTIDVSYRTPSPSCIHASGRGYPLS